MRYALKLFYFGKYEGFQRQPNKDTIEGHLETALKEAGLIDDLKSAAYISAGRTDRGVHALSQVVVISTSKKVVLPAINSFLPEGIVVWASKVVNEEFNPRYDALTRYYRYYSVYTNEDIDLIREGAQILEGIHDFNNFSKKHPEKNTIRNIHQIQVEKQESFLIFHIIADSFLWQMVRRIVDGLLRIGQTEWELQDLKDLLEGRPKSNIFVRPRPVSGQGALILWDIEYPFQFQTEKKSLDRVQQLLQNHLSELSIKNYYSHQFHEFFDLVKKNMK